MDIQILVNHFQENEQTVRRFLSSLARQKGVDFEVFLCSDGGGVRLTPESLSGFPFPISYSYATHSGVCHTRNLMLDKSTAEHVMFCDVDDAFSDPDGLKYILDAARKNHADVVGSPFSAERKMSGKMSCEVYNHDLLHVHGKLFRREYLVSNHIRFPDEMETSGDMLFLWLAFALTRHIKWIDQNFYIWKWNENSVTRQKPFHHVRTYDRTLRCYTILAENLKKRNRPDLYKNLIATLFGMVYVDLTHPRWYQAPEEYRKNVEPFIRQFLSSYFDDYRGIAEGYRRSKYFLMLRFTKGIGLAGDFEDMIPWLEGFLCETLSNKPDGHNQKNTVREPSIDVLIVGHGTVGQNLERDLGALSPAIYDKYKHIDTRNGKMKYSVAFICVDTPYSEDKPCDISEVRNAIHDNAADVYVVKSTVLPGTVDMLCAETGKNIVFSPEFYGGTQHCNNYSFDFTILGGDRKSCTRVIQILQRVYDARHQFRVTDAKTAELAKYMENCFLAAKVSFCNQFFNLAEHIGVSYEELRELFILDPRVGASHTFVYRDHPYWDSHCLNKDVRALAGTADAPFLDSIIRFNESQIRKKTAQQ